MCPGVLFLLTAALVSMASFQSAPTSTGREAALSAAMEKVLLADHKKDQPRATSARQPVVTSAESSANVTKPSDGDPIAIVDEPRFDLAS